MFKMILVYILLATIINSLIGFIGAFSLWMKKKVLDAITHLLISFSAGALLGGAFFHLLLESLEHLSGIFVFGYAIIGFILFLLIEGFFHSHLCESCQVHSFTYLMLIGDAIHNFIDGLVIAASFSINIFLGIITTLMILGHEAPQQVGLFGVLVYGGYKRKKALLYSFLVQSTCILGGIAGFLASSIIQPVSTFLVPFAAGGFIYIAASDLVPEMHKLYKGNFSRSLKILFAFFVGIGFMLALKIFLSY